MSFFLWRIHSNPNIQAPLDQSFVRGVAGKPEDAMIVDPVIGLARHLKLHVTAEPPLGGKIKGLSSPL